MKELKSDEFDAEVESATPTVVDFYADWCGPCRVVSPVLEKLSEEYTGRANFVKIDTDESPELAMKYGIMSIPTILIFKAGKVMETVIGAVPATVFEKKINAVI